MLLYRIVLVGVLQTVTGCLAGHMALVFDFRVASKTECSPFLLH
jgi:hypothetical protein